MVIFDLQASEAPHSYVVDVTDRAQIDAALKSIHEELGPVAILVNSAGLDGFKPFLKISFDQWQRVINVNLHGAFHMIQAVLPDMIEARWGRIVNISSSSTHSGTPYMTHYVSAKSGVNGLTKSLALEYGPTGVTVNAIPPGFIDTPMLRSAEQRATSATSRRRSPRRRCAGSASPRTSRRRARSWCQRKPATSPGGSSVSTAAAIPSHR